MADSVDLSEILPTSEEMAEREILIFSISFEHTALKNANLSPLLEGEGLSLGLGGDGKWPKTTLTQSLNVLRDLMRGANSAGSLASGIPICITLALDIKSSVEASISPNNFFFKTGLLSVALTAAGWEGAATAASAVSLGLGVSRGEANPTRSVSVFFAFAFNSANLSFSRSSRSLSLSAWVS